MHSRRRSGVLFGLWCVWAGCREPAGAPARRDAATDAPATGDAAPPRDAAEGADLPRDGMFADARRLCPRLVDAADCASDADQCRRTWAEVLASPLRCRPLRPGANWAEEVRSSCGAYEIVTVALPDSSYAYFYDKTTGQLTAIYGGGLPEVLDYGCLAGPPDGIPSCIEPPQTILDSCGPDAAAATSN